MNKLDLNNVTLIGCTTRDHTDTVLALQHCMKLCDFANIVYFSDIDPKIESIHWIECPKFMTYADICIWFMTSIFKYKEFFSGHILSIHWDGYIVSPDKWNKEFLSYDFIGSPWPNKLVGNNGFCMYSKKMIEGIESLKLPPTEAACHGSDKKISLVYRQQLIDFGVNFCPYDLAFQFSTETYGYYHYPYGFKYNGSFGFHGLYSIAGMKDYNVCLPDHHKHWLNYKGDEANLLSVPEFLKS